MRIEIGGAGRLRRAAALAALALAIVADAAGPPHPGAAARPRDGLTAPPGELHLVRPDEVSQCESTPLIGVSDSHFGPGTRLGRGLPPAIGRRQPP